MIHGPPFPISVADLTVEVLTLALDAPVVSFTSERIGADRGMLGEIFLVTPLYETVDAGPATVIVKFAALREQALASARRGQNHERELRCYDEMLSAASVSTPHLYGAWLDPDTAHFMLVQEAIDADTTVDQVAGIGPELAGLVAAEAATLHHERWDDPTLSELGWLPRLDSDQRLHNLTTIAGIGWQPLCDLMGTEMSERERELGAGFPERVDQVLRELATMPSTFIHSDLRADNLLFALDHRSVSLIDWQGAGIGPGSFDMAYLLSHSLTVEDRRTHADQLISDYLHALSSAGTTVSRDEFDAGFALGLHYGLVVACALPVIGDPTLPRVRQLATTVARRSLAALDDFNQLW